MKRKGLKINHIPNQITILQDIQEILIIMVIL